MLSKKREVSVQSTSQHATQGVQCRSSQTNPKKVGQL